MLKPLSADLTILSSASPAFFLPPFLVFLSHFVSPSLGFIQFSCFFPSYLRAYSVTGQDQSHVLSMAVSMGSYNDCINRLLHIMGSTYVFTCKHCTHINTLSGFLFIFVVRVAARWDILWPTDRCLVWSLHRDRDGTDTLETDARSYDLLKWQGVGCSEKPEKVVFFLGEKRCCLMT